MFNSRQQATDNTNQESSDIFTPKRREINGITWYVHWDAVPPAFCNPPGTNRLIDAHDWVHDVPMGKLLIPKYPFDIGKFALIVPRDTNLTAEDDNQLGHELGWCNEFGDRIIAALGLQGLVDYISFAVQFGNLYPGHKLPEPSFHVEARQKLFIPPEKIFDLKYPYYPPTFTDLPMFHITDPKNSHVMRVRCYDFSAANKAEITVKIAGASLYFVSARLCGRNGHMYEFFVKLTEEMYGIRDDAQRAWETARNIAWSAL